MLKWKAPAEQKHYGVYYASSGITPELNAHADEWTYENLVQVEKDICTCVERLAHMLLGDTTDLTVEERAGLYSWDIKAKRALTPHRTRAITVTWKKKGDKQPRRKSTVDMQYLSGCYHGAFDKAAKILNDECLQIWKTPEEWRSGYAPDLAYLDMHIKAWRSELKDISWKLHLLAGKDMPLQAAELYKKFPELTVDSKLREDVKGYIPRYDAIALPDWLRWTAEKLDATDIGRFGNQLAVVNYWDDKARNQFCEAVKQAQAQLEAERKAQSQLEKQSPLLAMML